MSEQGVIQDLDRFCCSICLELLKDPVTTACGHNYCMVCITKHWDRNEQRKINSCPECRKTFSPKPFLNKKIQLVELVERLKNTGLQAAPPADLCYAAPGDVACDVCTGRKQKALKSCLVCLASYCETHLQPHYDAALLKKHELQSVKASSLLQEKICPHHDKLLEVFCRTDQQCICYLCLLAEHKGHDTLSTAAEWTDKQSQLGESHQKVKQRIQEREQELKKVQQAVVSHNNSAKTAVENSETIFTEMIRSIRRRTTEVKELIRAQQRAAASQAKGLQERLEQEIAELRRRDSELEQLSHTDDHIHFLQNCTSLLSSSVSSDLLSITVCPPLFAEVTEAVSKMKEDLENLLQMECSNISTIVKKVVIASSEPKSAPIFFGIFGEPLSFAPFHLNNLPENNTSGLFSSLKSSEPPGTSIKFNPPSGTDPFVRRGKIRSINTMHQCITAMSQYEDKSLEELRNEDYTAGRKGPSLFEDGASTFTTTQSLFGSPASSTSGGLTATSNTGAFSFGSPASSTFGGGAEPSKTGGFSFGTTASSTFGAVPTPAKTGGSFGSPAFSTSGGRTATSNTGGFSFGSTASSTFGGGAEPSKTSGFLFGSTASSTFGGGTAPAKTSELLGTKASSTFGAVPTPAKTGGLFGTTASSTFGAVPTPAKTGGSFGTTASSTFGGGAEPSRTAGAFFGRPASSSFGGGAETSKKAGSIFGSIASSTFGAVPEPSKTGGLFGTTAFSTFEGGAEPSKTAGSIFGRTASATFGGGAEPSKTAGSIFGWTASAAFGGGAEPSKTAGSIFGWTASAAFGGGAEPSNTAGSIFGTTASSTFGAVPTPAKTGGLFGSPAFSTFGGGEEPSKTSGSFLGNPTFSTFGAANSNTAASSSGLSFKSSGSTPATRSSSVFGSSAPPVTTIVEPSLSDHSNPPEPSPSQSSNPSEPSLSEPSKTPEPSTSEPSNPPEPLLFKPFSTPEPSTSEPSNPPEPSTSEPSNPPEP